MYLRSRAQTQGRPAKRAALRAKETEELACWKLAILLPIPRRGASQARHDHDEHWQGQVFISGEELSPALPGLITTTVWGLGWLLLRAEYGRCIHRAQSMSLHEPLRYIGETGRFVDRERMPS